MSKLKAALAWAARGFPVFPLDSNGKEPAFAGAWYEHATTDPDRIRAMWSDPVLKTEIDYNIGMDCTDRVVFDIDVKKGKDGYNQYLQMGGTFDTLTVRTPSGGYHCYFEGPDSSNAPISDGVDVRSHHGYVVAPGSTIDGVPYEVTNDVEPIWLPSGIGAYVKAPDIRREVSADFEIDSAASIQAGINFLQSAPVAVEGNRGDETTFKTAARMVREMGLSPETVYQLMAEHWNPRCVPPWQLDELFRKVENASQYGTAELGRLDPSHLFGAVQIEPPPVANVVADIGSLIFGNARPAHLIPARPWLVDKMLQIGKVSMLGAVGSAGKSTVALALSAHMALGVDFGPYKVHKPCKTIVYNGEDDVDEQSRRLYAVCVEYGFDYDNVRNHVMLLSKKEVNMRLVSRGHGAPVRHENIIAGLKAIAKDEGVGCVILDPLIGIHFCDENNPSDMSGLLEVLEEVAEETNVAILILQHATKATNQKQEDRVGNMDIFRGSSGIVYACRAAFTLMDATETDVTDYGMQDGERHLWVRMDDAKTNITLKDAKPVWFKKLGVKIISGDVVGVLKQQELTKNAQHIRIRVAEALVTMFQSINGSTMQMAAAVARVKAEVPIFSNMKDSEVRQKLEQYFGGAGVELRGQTIKVTRETVEGKTDKIQVVLS